MPTGVKISIIIPLYNEVENVEPLLAHTHKVLADWQHPWELILVDDGSSDGTIDQLHHTVQHYNSEIHIVELQRNFGQTAAMQAGIDQADGELIVTLDGDMQNDPADIPRMVEIVLTKDLDLLSGWRRHRQDKLIIRKIPSKIANFIIRRVTGVQINDYGCSLKVYRTSVLRQVRLFGEMHRFIPAWFASVTRPSRIAEVEVKHNPRTLGSSKYGISRVFRVIIDLLTVLFFLRYQARPGHFFGAFGLVIGILGTVILSYLAGIKFILGEPIGSRPLLFVGVLCVIASLQFLTTGVLAEVMSRNYFGSTGKTPYAIRAVTHHKK
ncbi:MAG: glycosyltransferase family 2 protein [Gammaproteobacteria bacterium]|nr:glycosyltransferase family 2 protein [Gammaproteobacteria bacterium]